MSGIRSKELVMSMTTCGQSRVKFRNGTKTMMMDVVMSLSVLGKLN